MFTSIGWEWLPLTGVTAPSGLSVDQCGPVFRAPAQRPLFHSHKSTSQPRRPCTSGSMEPLQTNSVKSSWFPSSLLTLFCCTASVVISSESSRKVRRLPQSVLFCSRASETADCGASLVINTRGGCMCLLIMIFGTPSTRGSHCCVSFSFVCLFPQANMCLREGAIRPLCLWTRAEVPRSRLPFPLLVCNELLARTAAAGHENGGEDHCWACRWHSSPLLGSGVLPEPHSSTFTLLIGSISSSQKGNESHILSGPR